MRKILSLTGSRSDYAIMTPVFERIKASSDLDLYLFVTGMHLMDDFRAGLERIKNDKFGKLIFTPKHTFKDDPRDFITFLSHLISKSGEVIGKVDPDIILLQGDRGEMLALAIAASYFNKPIVHMSGGDFSGSIDDSIRNAITKFSHIHLTTCPSSSKRLCEMGEAKNRIFEVGEPGIDVIKNTKYIEKEILAQEYKLDLDKPLVLAIQHPVTTEYKQAQFQIRQTLKALETLKLQTIFLYPNNEAGNQKMIKVLKEYEKKKTIKLIGNISHEKYLSLLKISSLIIGNSSSGILEAASFKVPAINIGSRQYNRFRPDNVVDVDYSYQSIIKAINYCLKNNSFQKKLKKCRNPYGDGNTAQKTIEILNKLDINDQLLCKWGTYQGSFLK